MAGQIGQEVRWLNQRYVVGLTGQPGSQTGVTHGFMVKSSKSDSTIVCMVSFTDVIS